MAQKKNYKSNAKAKFVPMDEQLLYRSIREGDIRPCYYFYGKDTASIEEVAKRLISKLVPEDARDMNYRFFAGSELDLSELYDTMSALPMFTDRVVASINDLNADGMKSADVKFLKGIISEIDPATSVLIIYSTGVDLFGGKKTLTNQNADLAAFIAENGGAVCEFGYKQPQELVKYIQQSVTKLGCTIGYGAALSLAEASQCDKLMINNEIDKLTAYRAGGDITDSDISDLVSDRVDTDAYKLARAVTFSDRRAAFEIARELISKDEESVGLISVISNAFLDLYRAKLALMSGRGEQDIAKDFDYKRREFVIRNALRDCSKVTVEKLRYCLGILAQCDIDMKSKRTDRVILFEQAVAKMVTY